MANTMTPPDATSRDVSHPVATSLDTDFVLTIEQVADLYVRAGHPRTIRSLQRYCAKGHLDSQKKETTLGGEVYLVSPQSVARHIAQIEELSSGDTVAGGGRGRPGGGTAAGGPTNNTPRPAPPAHRSSRPRTSATFCASRSTAKTEPSRH
jgi:hypothetical protein